MLQAAVERDDRQPNAVPASMSLLIEQARPTVVTMPGHHPTRVYLIPHGNRIKIGLTTNIGRRIESLALPAGQVPLLLAGGRHLEAALHQRFAAFRVGRSEWFERSTAIEQFMQAKGRLPKLTSESLPLAPRNASGMVVELGRDALLRAARRALASGDHGVRLATILDQLKADGAPASWGVTDLRRAYEQAGVPVRSAVRANQHVSVGIRRADLEAADAPHATA
ncbi:GIY-YIG nuclease family protein [Streptomyces albidoflavus]